MRSSRGAHFGCAGDVMGLLIKRGVQQFFVRQSYGLVLA